MSDRFEEDRTETHYVLTVGTEVGHYRILERIGSGGMGDVYVAEDSQLDRKVALKFLSQRLCQDEDCRRRFRREAQAAAGLSHPNIVTIHDVGEYRGRPFIAMEYIEGRSLREVVKNEELAIDQAMNLTAQVCEGLQAAHDAGVVHRDVKPSNILVDSHGRARLIDFGLAAVLRDERLTKAGSTLGTVGYMSPEQARGQKVDQRSDVFSVGAVLYELITGRRPFRGEDEAATLHAITHDIPEPLARYRSRVPEELQRLVGKALEKNPEARYQHVDDLRVDLVRLALQADTSVGSVRPVARGRRLWWYPATAALLALIVILWWVIPLGRRGSASALKHLVVLPFTDLGDVSTSRAIGDGLMETLSSKLTQMEQFHGALLVVPASEVRENQVAGVRQARKVFGVTHAVTGSVQQHSDRIQITLNLVDTRSERQLHSAVFDEALYDISGLVDSSVTELARMLEIQLRPGERRVLSAGVTASPGAYYSYLQARGHLQRHHHDENPESIDSAIYCFDDAVRRDPHYALAYAGLGEAYWHKYNLSMDVQWAEPAIEYSRHAAELSDQLSPVYVTLGLTHNGTGRYDDAVRYFQQALAIDSLNRGAYVGLAEAYESLGKFSEAESTYLRAIELKPESWGGYFDLGMSYAYAGRYEDALRWLREAELLAPDAVLPCNDLGGLYLYLGHTEEAMALLQRSLEIEPNYSAYSNLGIIYETQDLDSDAADMYERALNLDDRDYRVWINLADVLPDQEHEKALAAYRRAIQLAEEHREINPNDPWLLCHLAHCYAATGEFSRALASAQQAVELAPETGEILVRAGLVYETSGNRQEAQTLIGKALAHGYSKDELKEMEELHDLMADPRMDSLVMEN